MRYQKRSSTAPEPGKIEAAASVAVVIVGGAIIVLMAAYSCAGLLNLAREVCGCK